MTGTPHTQPNARRRCAGRVSPTLIVVLLGLAGAVAAVGYLAIDQRDDAEAEPARTSQAEIDRELDALQQAFQQLMQEGLDLERIESRARVFTEDHPGEVGGYVLLAQVQMSLQQWESAYQAWSDALRRDPASYEFNKMAGFCAAKLGRLDQAEQHYRDAARLARDAADSEVFAALGRLYLALGRPDEAKAAFGSSMNAPGPGSDLNLKHQAYAGLADVAAYLGDDDRALELVQTAIDRGQSDSKADVPGYKIQQARIYMDAGRDPDAVLTLALMWDQHPGSDTRIESARLRARLFERAGQIDRAVNHINGALNIHLLDPKRKDPVLADFYALLAEWQIKAGRYDAARTSLHNLETKTPKHPRLDALRAELP